MSPLRRKERTALERSYSGARAFSRKSPRAIAALKSNTLRKGALRPSIRDQPLSHFQRPPLMAAAAPAIRRQRRVSRWISLGSTSRSGLSIGALLVLGQLDRHNMVPDKHGSKVIPSCAEDLRNMHQEEQDVGEGQPEVKPARHLVAAEQGREDMKLSWFVNGKSGQQRTHTHQNDTCVCDPLRIIEFLLW